MMVSEYEYRSDIDGLRAIAVIPVLAFHLGLALAICSGGFVGVDIFFVISGYLISKSILSSLQCGTFSVIDFYRRRFRRIFPALFATYAACIVATLALSFPDEGSNTANGILSSIFFVSNIFFSHAAGYFNFETQFNPIIHTWSLSVEEQFYCLFPILLSLTYKIQQKWLPHLIIMMLAVSLIISQALVYTNPAQSFYLMQSRAWELLIGAVLGLRILPLIASKRVAELIGCVGLVLIGCSISLLTPAFYFPGFWALVPCIGTAMVIYSGINQKTIVFRILSMSPLRFIGVISYSLYLIHWPIIVFTNSILLPERRGKIVMFCGCIVLAALSWRFIELPFRRKPYFLSSRLILPVSAIAMMITSAATLFVRPAIQAIWQVPPRADQVLAYEKFDAAAMNHVGTCMLTNVDRFDQFMKSDCLKINPKKKNILLLGDSHAAHLLYGLSRVNPDVNFLLAAVGSCPPTEQGDKTRLCAEMMHYMLHEFIPNAHLDGIVLAARWGESDVERVRTTALTLSKILPNVYVFGPIVEYDQPLPRLLAKDLTVGGSNFVNAHRRSEQVAIDKEIHHELSGSRIIYISMYKEICETTCRTYADDGAPLQFDYGHLTEEGSLYVASRLSHLFN